MGVRVFDKVGAWLGVTVGVGAATQDILAEQVMQTVILSIDALQSEKEIKNDPLSALSPSRLPKEAAWAVMPGANAHGPTRGGDEVMQVLHTCSMHATPDEDTAMRLLLLQPGAVMN